MNENEGTGPVTRLLSVIGFFTVCALIFGFLWTNSGGHIPLVKDSAYTVEVTVPRVANLVYFSDVMVGGVKVGKVRDVTEHGDHATALIELDDSVAPLHEKATVQVRAKSLIDESYLDIVDGKGAEVGDGGALSAASGKAPTQLNDVLAALDPTTREELGKVVRSAGAAAAGSQPAIADAVAGLGDLGRNGEDVIGAIAAQSDDLKSLTRSSTRVLTALATRRTQLSQLVTDAQQITEATAGQSGDVEAVIKALPPLMASARDGSDDLERLATSLTPVASNLDAAAGDLSAALVELPASASDLRGLLPDLNGVVDKVPATVTRVPKLSADVEGLISLTSALLTDVNPVLGYLEPYGSDVAAFFTNFAQTLGTGDVNGRAFRVMPPFNEQSLKGIPLNTNIGPLDKFNALPKAGTSTHPGPQHPTYTRVEREPAPR